MGPDIDKKLAPYKRTLYSGVSGNVLEIGSGHGATFQYFDQNKIDHITCLEPNEAMHEKLKENAKVAGFEEEKGNVGFFRRRTLKESSSVDSLLRS